MAEEIVDVLIIGSGHSGGMAAKILTEKGISCLMLNAGPVADAHKDTEPKPAYACPSADSNSRASCRTSFRPTSSTPTPGSTKRKSPTPTTRSTPTTGCACASSAAARSSGRVNPSGSATTNSKASPTTVTATTGPSASPTWPHTIHASKPSFVSRVKPTASRNIPTATSSPTPRHGPQSMQRFIAAGKQRSIPVCKARSSLGVDGLASSVNLLLPDAFATGKLEAIPNVVVRQLSVDKNTGLVNEVHFVDRISRREMSVKARVVVLGRRNPRKHTPVTQLKAGQLQRSHGPLPHRSGLRPRYRLLRA